MSFARFCLTASRSTSYRLSHQHICLHAHPQTRHPTLSDLQTSSALSGFHPTSHPLRSFSTFWSIAYSRYYHSTPRLETAKTSEPRASFRLTDSLGGLHGGRQSRQRLQVFNPSLHNSLHLIRNEKARTIQTYFSYLPNPKACPFLENIALLRLFSLRNPRSFNS